MASGGVAGSSGSATGGFIFGTGGTGGFIFGTGGVPIQGCAGVSVRAQGLPKDLYVMLDRSTSMGEMMAGDTQSKWDATVAALRAFAASDGAAETRLALQYFGLEDACNPDAYAVPDVALDAIPTVSGAVVTSTEAAGPLTLTPTAPAVQGGLAYVGALAPSADRARALVLLTDGFPIQCGVACSVDTDCASDACVSGVCEPNALAELEALAARYVADAGVFTFVVAIGDGLDNFEVLASEGGTGFARRVETGDLEAQIGAHLEEIADAPAGCTLKIPAVPGEPFDPSYVNLELRDTTDAVPETVPRVLGPTGCQLGEGWYFDSSGDPSRVIMCPTTCERSATLTVEFMLGCATLFAEAR